MALTKEYSVDYDIRTEYRHIQIREKTAIMENGVELSHLFNYRNLTPDKDVSNETDEIKHAVQQAFT